MNDAVLVMRYGNGVEVDALDTNKADTQNWNRLRCPFHVDTTMTLD